MKTNCQYDSLNIKEIDEQHNQINVCVTELERISEAVDKKHVIMPLIDELISTCILHFTSEENLMKKYKFENIFSHKYEHDRCIRKIKEFSSMYEDNEENLSELLIFINNWMKNHIEMKDKRFAEFINNFTNS